MDEDLRVAGDEKFVCKANDAIFIRLAQLSDWESYKPYHPEFTHQIFGDNEVIYGYSKLRIDLIFTAGSLKCWMKIKHAEKDSGSVTEIAKEMEEWIPDLTQTMERFNQWMQQDEDKFKPIGKVLKQYTLKDDDSKTYIITQGSRDTEGLEAFHKRVQVFAIFEIDAARYLDDDPRWEFFYLFEKSTVNGKERYSTVGYATWYRFFHYPDQIRPRISQFLILPPHQGKGHGRKLYETIFQDLVSRKDVADIAVEDPAEGFQTMRTLCDLRYLINNSFVSGLPLDTLLDKEKVNLLQKTSKLSPKQTVRCLEILALKNLKGNKRDTKKLRFHLKKRFFKEDEGLGGIEKAERYEKLDAMCDSLIAEYQEIIQKLSS